MAWKKLPILMSEHNRLKSPYNFAPSQYRSHTCLSLHGATPWLYLPQVLKELFTTDYLWLVGKDLLYSYHEHKLPDQTKLEPCKHKRWMTAQSGKHLEYPNVPHKSSHLPHLNHAWAGFEGF